MMKNLICTLLSFFAFSFLLAIPDYHERQLVNMTLEELMGLEIKSGTLTGIEKIKFPGTMTIITEQEILSASSRNIYDLIEMYVPGAIYVLHYQGIRLGIRGILSDQNYSYQILLNGRNINFNAYFGAFLELQNKDLYGIERIEIISGSGSSTYGPGATAGVINIVTKRPSGNSFDIFYDYDIGYRVSGNHFSIENTTNEIKFLLYGSVYRSKGLKDTRWFYVDRGYNFNENQPWGWGFMSPDWGNFGRGDDVPGFLGDYQDEPEVKMLFEAEYKNNLLRTYYSTYNHFLNTEASASSEGKAYKGQFARNFLLELENSLDLSFINLTNNISFSSTSFEEIALWKLDQLAFNHIAQKRNSFSENDFTYNSLVNYQISNKYKFALGGEYSYQYYGPEWGKEDETFIMNFPAPIQYAVKNKDSGFYKYYGDESATIISEDIAAHTYSFFGEANLSFHQLVQVLASARIDKHEFSDFAFSPRISFISEVSTDHILGFIYSKSERFPLFTDLYAQDYLCGDNAKSEKKKGYEIIYNYQILPNLNLKSTFYSYSIDQISWINQDIYTDLIGTYDLKGFESEIKLNYGSTKTIINYSYINQTDWDPETQMLSYISDTENIVYLQDYGENRINNFPAQTFKFIFNNKLTNDINFNLNGRFFWDYQHSKMLDLYEDAHNQLGNEILINTMSEIREDLEEHGYGKPSARLNTSILWKIHKNDFDFNIKIYANNLVSYNNVRYVIQFWEEGNNRQFPRQCSFIKEPVTTGMSIEVGF